MKSTTLSGNIVYHRRRIHYAQRSMASALGIKHSRYGAWEEGRAKPPHDYLLKLAEVFGITVEQLLKPLEDETRESV